jgi:hypothetical protein
LELDSWLEFELSLELELWLEPELSPDVSFVHFAYSVRFPVLPFAIVEIWVLNAESLYQPSKV